ncbi:hypothetical protein PMEGAPL103_50320 [Priestia megaterium]
MICEGFRREGHSEEATRLQTVDIRGSSYMPKTLCIIGLSENYACQYRVCPSSQKRVYISFHSLEKTEMIAKPMVKYYSR